MASKTQDHLIRERNHQLDQPARETPHVPLRGLRQSEFPVSQHGMNQESEHNKHNNAHKGAAKH